jgi:hypothetical protein
MRNLNRVDFYLEIAVMAKNLRRSVAPNDIFWRMIFKTIPMWKEVKKSLMEDEEFSYNNCSENLSMQEFNNLHKKFNQTSVAVWNSYLNKYDYYYQYTIIDGVKGWKTLHASSKYLNDFQEKTINHVVYKIKAYN